MILDTVEAIIKCTIITILKCTIINLIKMVQDKVETTVDTIEEATMTSVFRQEIEIEEVQVDNTTIITLTLDNTITMITTMSTMIDNTIDLIANNISCTIKVAKAQRDNSETNLIDKIEFNGEMDLKKTTETKTNKECKEVDTLEEIDNLMIDPHVTNILIETE